MSRETQSQCEQQAHCKQNSSPNQCGISEPKREQEVQQETKRGDQSSEEYLSEQKKSPELGTNKFKIGTCISSSKGTQQAQHVAYGALRKENTDVIFLRDTKQNMKKEIDCSQRTILEAFRLLIA